MNIYLKFGVTGFNNIKYINMNLDNEFTRLFFRFCLL